MEILDEKVEELTTDAPVYVKEDAIPDVLTLNELNQRIADINADKDTKETEVSELESDREELSDKIGIINNGMHINEVGLYLKNLRELDESLSKKKDELEEVYAELRREEDDRKALDETTRRMVDKMTEEYNSLVLKFNNLVEQYRRSADFSIYKESNDILDELNTYKKFESFDAIFLGDESKDQEVEENKEEEKTEEASMEEKVDTPVEEAPKAEVTPIVEEKNEEFSNVKVDNLPEEKAEVTPIVEEAKVEEPVTTNTVNIPSFEELLKKANEEQEVATPEVSVAPVEEAPKAEVTMLPNFSKDRIADSTVNGIKATIETFNPKDVDKTLTLAA